MVTGATPMSSLRLNPLPRIRLLMPVDPRLRTVEAVHHQPMLERVVVVVMVVVVAVAVEEERTRGGSRRCLGGCPLLPSGVLFHQPCIPHTITR